MGRANRASRAEKCFAVKKCFAVAMAPSPSTLIACPNASGECATEGCAATACPLWYGKKGNKICTPCYRQAKKRALQQAARASSGAGRAALRPAQIFSIDTIYGCRLIFWRRAPACPPRRLLTCASLVCAPPCLPLRAGM